MILLAWRCDKVYMGFQDESRFWKSLVFDVRFWIYGKGENIDVIKLKVTSSLCLV